MDSLMDAMTNVVGVLLLILIVSSLGITAAVKKIVENLPEVTVEELEAMRTSRQNTLDNLQELRQTHRNTVENMPTEEEARKLVADLEEFERDNAELAEKTSDIEEWKAKVEAETEIKEEREERVLDADKRNRELAAILAQTPEVAAPPPKEITIPNPRLAPEEARAVYVVCRNKKLYLAGDPYDHAFRIRDVIDQNFSDLAFTGKQVGSYTYWLRGTRTNDNGAFEPLLEDVRLTRGLEKELASWAALKPVWANAEGVVATPERNLLQRLFGADEKGEFAVMKFRYDLKKITDFFGDGKFGPKDFRYYVSAGGGDRIKFLLGFREEGGWTVEQFKQRDSAFDQQCKRAATNRRTFFYYYVAPDSFDTYLEARTMSEFHRVPAGWTIWEGDRLEMRGIPERSTVEYNLDTLPAGDYRQIAHSVGPFLVEELNKEREEFADRVAAAVPEDLEGPEKQKFIAELTAHRNQWNARQFQSYAVDPFKAALAASKASGQAIVQVEIHPPEIPHIRVFKPSRPPAKPPEPPQPEEEKPEEEPPTGGTRLILD